MKTCPERNRNVLKAKKGLLEADLVCKLASFASFLRSAESLSQLGGVERDWRGMSLLAALWSAFHHSKMFSCDSVAIERPRPPRLLNTWRKPFLSK